MSTKTKSRAKALRARPEVARLRAIGGLSQLVIVDGASLARWSGRVHAVYSAVLQALIDAADAGGRRILLVAPAPPRLPAPHTTVTATANVAALLRGDAFAHVDLPRLPSVVVADIARDPQLLDSLETGASYVLDLASGRLWSPEDAHNRYDIEHAATEGRLAERTAPHEAASLAAAIAPTVRVRRQPLVVASFHRHGDESILDRVGIDDGSRRYAEGHAACLTLLRQLFESGAEPVMTSSLDVLDTLYDASLPLPPAVEDPAFACVLLDPDTRSVPPGVGPLWHQLLGRRTTSAVRVPLGRMLDELPRLHAELRAALTRESLINVFDHDLAVTVPLMASVEREGFYIDDRGLAHDLAAVVSEMASAWQIATSGNLANEFAALDLVRAPSEVVAELIVRADGRPPEGWRTDQPNLERLALAGNPRAKAVERLRGLDAVHGWMTRLEGKTQVRSVLEPHSTGRWYAREEALFTIPKHQPEARLLRRHFVPKPGHAFVSGDFSAFEPRLLAHQADDPVLSAGAAHDKDIYTHLMPLLGASTREVAKKALLAFINGQTAKAFAASLPLPSPEGHRIFAALATALPKVAQFRQHVTGESKDSAASMFGWRRLRGTTPHGKFARRSFNLKMQGTAGDLLRKLLRDLHAALPRDARVVHQEFDGVIVTCLSPMVAHVEEILKNTMENVALLSIPLVAKTKSGATLADVS